MEFPGISEPNNPDNFSLPPFPKSDFENDKWNMDSFNISYPNPNESLAQGVKRPEDLIPMPTYVDNEGLNKQGYVQVAETGQMSKSKVKKQSNKRNPWTEEEHRLFLMGLNRYGKGSWKRISENYVKTKTSVQIASHAQSFYNRQNKTIPNKKRRCINDMRPVSSISQLSQVRNNIAMSPNVPQLDPYQSQNDSNLYSQIYANFQTPCPMVPYGCILNPFLNSMKPRDLYSTLNFNQITSNVQGSYYFSVLESSNAPSTSQGGTDFTLHNIQGSYDNPVIKDMPISSVAQVYGVSEGSNN